MQQNIDLSQKCWPCQHIQVNQITFKRNKYQFCATLRPLQDPISIVGLSSCIFSWIDFLFEAHVFCSDWLDPVPKHNWKYEKKLCNYKSFKTNNV